MIRPRALKRRTAFTPVLIGLLTLATACDGDGPAGPALPAVTGTWIERGATAPPSRHLSVTSPHVEAARRAASRTGPIRGFAANHRTGPDDADSIADSTSSPFSPAARPR